MDESQENYIEDDAKAKIRNDTRFTVAKSVVPVGIKKSVAGEAVLKEPEPDATLAIVISEEEEYKNPENTKLDALKLKTIAKLEKLIHIKKVATIPVNAVVMNKYWFDKVHNCVVAEFLVIVTVFKTKDMLVNYSKLMNEVTRLDIIYKLLLSFPWRPGVLSCWCVYFVLLMNVFVLELLYVLLQSQVYSVMTGVTTVAFVKFSLESEDGEVELLDAESSLFLPNTAKPDLDQEEDMQEDQTASADTPMVILTLLSQAEV